MKKNENAQTRVISKFAEKKGMIEILEQTFSFVNDLKRDCTRDFRKVGVEQRVRNGEPCWEDEAQTIPEMRDKWEHVDITPDEMSDEVYAKYMACEAILKTLDEMI